MRDEGDVKDNESEKGMGEEGTKGEGWKGIKTWSRRERGREMENAIYFGVKKGKERKKRRTKKGTR